MNPVSECIAKFKFYFLSSLKLLIQNDLLVFYHQRRNSVNFLNLYVDGETSSHIGDILVPITPEYIAQAIIFPLIGKECHLQEKRRST